MRTTPWTERVIALHPVLVTGIFLLLFVGGGAAVNIFRSGPGMVIWSITMLVMTAPVVVWHYSLRNVATTKAAAGAALRARPPMLFVILIVAFPVFLVLAPFVTFSEVGSTPTITEQVLAATLSALLFVVVISYFGAIWSAAAALTRYERGAAAVPVHHTLGTFILEFYLPIGIWFLYPRIRKMLAHC